MKTSFIQHTLKLDKRNTLKMRVIHTRFERCDAVGCDQANNAIFVELDAFVSAVIKCGIKPDAFDHHARFQREFYRVPVHARYFYVVMLITRNHAAGSNHV